MNYATFSQLERRLALVAGIVNIIVGLGFFFMPELGLPFWPVPANIPILLDRFIGAIILGNGAGALLLARESEWARVRPLALVAMVYGTLVAVAVLYHLLALNESPIFWIYFIVDVPFLLVFYALFVYHDYMPRRARRKAEQARKARHAEQARQVRQAQNKLG